MDYTKDPDCKLPLALIVNMPELKVKIYSFKSDIRLSPVLNLAPFWINILMALPEMDGDTLSQTCRRPLT